MRNLWTSNNSLLGFSTYVTYADSILCDVMHIIALLKHFLYDYGFMTLWNPRCLV